MAFKTDYKDQIPLDGRKLYQLIDNNTGAIINGNVRIARANGNAQEGDVFGAAQLNEISNYLNNGVATKDSSGKLTVSMLPLGETVTTAYAGNKGKANADEILKIKNGTTRVPNASTALGANLSDMVVGYSGSKNAIAFTWEDSTVKVRVDNSPDLMMNKANLANFAQYAFRLQNPRGLKLNFEIVNSVYIFPQGNNTIEIVPPYLSGWNVFMGIPTNGDFSSANSVLWNITCAGGKFYLVCNNNGYGAVRALIIWVYTQ